MESFLKGVGTLGLSIFSNRRENPFINLEVTICKALYTLEYEDVGTYILLTFLQ
jgi:hypothetical protein